MTSSPDHPRHSQPGGLLRGFIGVGIPCLVFLVGGVWLGQAMIRGQFEVQQLLVAQLQQEIRGLTGDIQRVEFGHVRFVQDFESALHTLIEQERVRTEGAVDRAGSLEKSLARELSASRAAKETILAEFAHYSDRSRAVPVPEIERVLDRCLNARITHLERSLDLVRAQVREDEAHLAVLAEAPIRIAMPTPRGMLSKIPSPFAEGGATTVASTPPAFPPVAGRNDPPISEAGAVAKAAPFPIISAPELPSGKPADVPGGVPPAGMASPTVEDYQAPVRHAPAPRRGALTFFSSGRRTAVAGNAPVIEAPKLQSAVESETVTR